MRLPDKRVYAAELLRARIDGAPEPCGSGERYEAEVLRRLDRILGWPASRCVSCRQRLAVRRGATAAGGDVPLCETCDEVATCLDCERPRGQLSQGFWLRQKERQALATQPRQRCPQCEVAHALGWGRNKVSRRWRLRQWLEPVPAWSAILVLVVASVIGLRIIVGINSFDAPASTKDAFASTGADSGQSRARGYLGGATNGLGGSGGSSGSTGYGPGLVPHFVCADGAVSYAQQSRGACSHHGGIGGLVGLASSSGDPAGGTVPEATSSPEEPAPGVVPLSRPSAFLGRSYSCTGHEGQLLAPLTPPRDGRSFVYVRTIGETSLTYDLVQSFFGDEAEKAAREDGAMFPADARDLYTRNQSARLRAAQISAATHFGVVCGSQVREISASEFRGLFRDGGRGATASEWRATLFTLKYQNGRLATVDEQYQP